MHWDFTSVAFCGAYTDQHLDGPRIGFGHSSDHQGHHRQLKIAHATTATGIALFGKVSDGGRHEGAETHELLETLRALAEPKRLLLLADSELVTKANLADADADADGIRFVSRLPRTFDYEPDAFAVPDADWRTLAYCSDRSRRLPVSQRPSMSPRQYSPDRLLALYKHPALSERAHHFLKWPPRRAARVPQSNRRAAALVAVCSIALLIYGLIEPKPATTSPPPSPSPASSRRPRHPPHRRQHVPQAAASDPAAASSASPREW